MKLGAYLRDLFRSFPGEFSPRHMSLRSAGNRIAPVAGLMALAAIAGAVVLTPPRRAHPDFTEQLRRRVIGLFGQRISNRAGVDLFEDFSQGLDDWRGAENRTRAWSYDRNGFARVGALALFVPSLRLTDYDVDALAEINARGLTLAFRAASRENYEAVKILLSGSGALRSVAVQSYAVIDGRPTRPRVKNYPGRVPSDTMFQIHLAVHGNTFSLYLQGKLVTDWSDSRLASGGVGLACSSGEQARVAWIRVTHNADSLGKVCAFLSSLLAPS
jgi:hypothetical protein